MQKELFFESNFFKIILDNRKEKDTINDMITAKTILARQLVLEHLDTVESMKKRTLSYTEAYEECLKYFNHLKIDNAEPEARRSAEFFTRE